MLFIFYLKNTNRMPELNIQKLIFGRDTPLIQSEFNFRSDEGNLIVLAGLNGSGKTTLLKTLCGLITPLQGEIFVEGQKIGKNKELNAAKTAFVNTERIKEPYITVRELAEFGLRAHPSSVSSSSTYRSLDIYLNALGLENIQDKPLSQISDGEWQKSNIVRALLQNTPLILMDEPSAFLDFPSRIQLLKMLSELTKTENKTIILSTHDLDSVEEFASQYWFLGNQKLEILTNHAELMGKVKV